MKQQLRVLFLLTFLHLGSTINAQTFHQVSYQGHDSVICNPERGFFHFSTAGSDGAYNYLNLNTLLGYRANGITLIHRYYYIDAFVDKDISGDYLLGMKNDFEVLRQAGLKAVIRFAYCESMSKPYGDAPIDIVLRHIEQLKPIIRAHSDVIQSWQAGFIGAWGEWYYTDYFSFSPGVIMPEHWALRRQVVNAILDALPPTRQVVVRTPGYKQHLLENDQPVSAEQAYSDLSIARIGHHNDCFVSSADDYGTYDDTATEKPYLAADTRYTMINGETCNPAPPYSDCPNSLHELRRFHWTCLNLDYNGTLLNGWRNQGCFDEIFNKLGYRYRMIRASIQDAARPGGELQVNLKMINEGFANPVNPRLAELIIRNTGTGREYTYRISQDPRFWPLNDTIFLNIQAGIPQNIEPGEYSIFLNMPDPEMTLYNNPDFSIRYANVGTWENTTGFNSLKTSFSVEDNPALPAYGGTGFFYPRQPEIVQAADIYIDGWTGDWDELPAGYSTTGQPATSIKIYNDEDSLFFLVEGNDMQNAFQLFIDADNETATGYSAWQWQANGSDYLVENGRLYKHQGGSGEWNWVFIDNVNLSLNPDAIELSLHRSDLNGTGLAGLFSYAFVNDPQNTVQACYLPAQNGYFIPYIMLLPFPEDIDAKVFGNNVIPYWTGTSDESLFTVLQRTAGGDYETIGILNHDDIAFSDLGVGAMQNYEYRIYRTNGLAVSAMPESVGVLTGPESNYFLDMKIDGLMDDWYGLEPLATSYSAHWDFIETFRLANYGDSLYFCFETGDLAKYYSLYLNSDRNESTGLPDPSSTPGFDFKLSRDSLFAANGQSWTFARKITWKYSGIFCEGCIAMPEINMNDASSIFVSGTGRENKLPDYAPYVEFIKLSQPGTPLYFLVRNSEAFPDTRFIIEWSIPDNCQGYIIERSVGDSAHFVPLADLPYQNTYYHDNSVSKDTAYYYRMYSYSSFNRSPYTIILGGYPGTVTFGTGESAFNAATLKVYPNPVKKLAKVELWMKYPADVSADIYNLSGIRVAQLFSGEAEIYNYFTIPAGMLKPGVYFIKISGNNLNLAEKLVIQ